MDNCSCHLGKLLLLLLLPLMPQRLRSVHRINGAACLPATHLRASKVAEDAVSSCSLFPCIPLTTRTVIFLNMQLLRYLRGHCPHTYFSSAISWHHCQRDPIAVHSHRQSMFTSSGLSAAAAVEDSFASACFVATAPSDWWREVTSFCSSHARWAWPSRHNRCTTVYSLMPASRQWTSSWREGAEMSEARSCCCQSRVTSRAREKKQAEAHTYDSKNIDTCPIASANSREPQDKRARKIPVTETEERDCILSRSSLNRISSLSVVGMSA